MTKILCYSHSFFPSVGGIEVSTQIFSQELVTLGHRVTIATKTKLAGDQTELNEGYNIVRGCNFFTLLKLAKKSDVVVIRGGIAFAVAISAIITFSSLMVVYEVGPRHHKRVATLRFREAVISLKEKVKHIFKYFAEKHVGVSRTILDQQAPRHASIKNVLYNPVRKELWTEAPYQLAERPIDVAFVGRIIESKGIFTLVKAIEMIPNNSALRVVLVGSGESELSVRKYCHEMKLPVEFLGPKNGEELRQIFCSSKIIAVPSLAYEGMGMTAAEALASGTPVCASDQPALREVAKDAALYHEIGNVEELARDLRRLLTEQELWLRTSGRATEVRRFYALEAYRATLSDIFRSAEASVESTEAHDPNKALKSKN